MRVRDMCRDMCSFGGDSLQDSSVVSGSVVPRASDLTLWRHYRFSNDIDSMPTLLQSHESRFIYMSLTCFVVLLIIYSVFSPLDTLFAKIFFDNNTNSKKLITTIVRTFNVGIISYSACIHLIYENKQRERSENPTDYTNKNLFLRCSSSCDHNHNRNCDGDNYNQTRADINSNITSLNSNLANDSITDNDHNNDNYNYNYDYNHSSNQHHTNGTAVTAATTDNSDCNHDNKQQTEECKCQFEFSNDRNLVLMDYVYNNKSKQIKFNKYREKYLCICTFSKVDH